MKLNVVSKNFRCLSVALLFFTLSIIFCHASLAEIEWQREYGAVVNGEYLPAAYVGGIEFSKPTFVDIDNDGDSDMFIGCSDGTIHYYRNDGTPHMPSWTVVTENYNSIDAEPWSSPTFCDIDADGDYDMFIGEAHGNIWFYRNDGTPSLPSWTFVTDNYNSINVGSYHCYPTFCDIDGDGDYDMFIGAFGGNICFYQNNGTPSLPSWTFVADNYNSIQVEGLSTPTFCDIDNDGDYDMFIGEYYNGNIAFYRNDGTLVSPLWTFITNNYTSSDIGNMSAPVFCDIDGDGDYDMFIGEESGNTNFYRNDGSCISAFLVLVTEDCFRMIDVGEMSNSAFCDIDNDGDYDMFIGEENGNINFYQNNGTSATPSWVLISENYNNVTTQGSAPTFCDIDDDGDYDMFVGDTYKIHFYRNDGTPSSASWTFITDNYGSIRYNGWCHPTFCDIDADGDYDLFIGGPSIWFYRNDGTPESSLWTLVSKSYNNVTGHAFVAFCDIDSDGDYDMFVGKFGDIKLYQNNGMPFSPVWTLLTQHYDDMDEDNEFFPAFCDIDNDGDYDMFAGEYPGGGINFWRNMTITDSISPTTNINISGTLGNNGWYISDVQVALTATDNEDGTGVSKTECSFNNTDWNTYAVPFAISTEGATIVYYRSLDNAGNIEETRYVALKIDKTAPQVIITTPTDASEYILGSSVIADWTATDDISGIDTAIGTVENGGTIAMSDIGTHSFNVAAVDKAGNQTTKTSTYYVRYSYSGVLQPINPDGTSVFKIGRVIPVKFWLQNADGAYISTANAKIYLAKISNDVAGEETEAEATGNANTGNLFRYDSMNNQYIFNLGTKGLSPGTWQIRIVLDDGASYYTLISLR